MDRINGMKHRVRAALVLGMMVFVTTLAITGVQVCQLGRVQAAEETSGGLPPLVVDKDAPLLLDDGPRLPWRSKKATADNSACYVCHENYREEEMVHVHAIEDIGCVDCHGDSFAHRNDENNITPPDVMYPAKKIDSSCQECHESHNVLPRGVVKRYLERCPEKTDFSTVYCTDCHGEHRLKSRSVRWDKVTGKLIESE
jgi:hypothetical protein